jgi:superfamily II DNA or RNA helicase
MIDLRSRRQKEAEDAWNFNKKSIINSCPRFGKILTSINIIKNNNYKKILISIPRLDIKESWENDFIKWGFKPENVEYVTYKSAKKFKSWQGDLIILDEIQEASLGELKELSNIVDNNNTLGLSGTITKKTENRILELLGIGICYKYSIEQGVEEKILVDYNINIHLVNLDKIKPVYNSKYGLITESKKFQQLMYVKNKLLDEDKPTHFIDLKCIQLLQNSIAKQEYTKKLLDLYKEQRVLVFCGVTKIADSLDIPVYHSKAKEKKILQDFCEGEGLNLATIKMAQSGLTIKPINRGILNYTSGNPEDTAQKICRFLGIEYNNLDKKAEIDIICSNTAFEKERLKTGLSFFDENKIKYITSEQ